MSVKVNLHPYLIHLTDNKDILEVSGKTVGECLEQAVEQYPGLREWIFSKDGTINNMFEIFVNMESTYPEGLAKPVQDGDDIQIIIVIAGG